MKILTWPLFIWTFFFASKICAQSTTPIGHSHNDYDQEEIIHSALKYGLSSLEIDIIQVGDEIIVSHEEDEYIEQNTLEKMYLKPLMHLLSQDNGYALPSPITLLIDLKMEGIDIHEKLHEICSRYPTLFLASSKKDPPFQIILSGSVEKQLLSKNGDLHFFLSKQAF